MQKSFRLEPAYYVQITPIPTVVIRYHLVWIRLFAVDVWIWTGFQQVVLIHQSSFHQCVAELYHCLEAQHAKLRKHSIALLFQLYLLRLATQEL